MIIAVASGKGGTGKTTVTVNLAASIGRSVRVLDCDVEEPDAHLFLKPVIRHVHEVGIAIPAVDPQSCTGCGACSDACLFNALLPCGGPPLLFEELCHGCGACRLACPEGAIWEKQRTIGTIELGEAGEIGFAQGRLDVGEPLAPPLIRAVRRESGAEHLTLIDAPPGVSCPVVHSLRSVDYALLVTEPTPFGQHDLALVVDLVKELGIPHGVVVNRAGLGDTRVHRWCEERGTPVLLEIPEDRRIAQAGARGNLAVDTCPGLAEKLRELVPTIEELRTVGVAGHN